MLNRFMMTILSLTALFYSIDKRSVHDSRRPSELVNIEVRLVPDVNYRFAK